MTDGFNKQIEGLTAELEAIRAPMAAERAIFVREAAAWAAAFWEEQAKKIVLKSPELAKEHGTDGTLKALRGALRDLVDGAPDRAARAFSEVAWPDEAGDITRDDGLGSATSDYARSGFRPPANPAETGAPPFMRECCTTLLSEVRAFMRRFGYPETPHPGSYGADSDYKWRRWSAGMLSSMTRYAELHEQLLSKREDLNEAMSKRAEQEAADAWESAV